MLFRVTEISEQCYQNWLGSLPPPIPMTGKVLENHADVQASPQHAHSAALLRANVPSEELGNVKSVEMDLLKWTDRSSHQVFPVLL